jgi:chromosomal replication initiation ATPase DnaA
MNERLPEIWKSVLQQLRSEMNNQTFETWFADTKAVNINDNVLTLAVQDDVVKKHINDNYQDMISSILVSVTGKPVFCKNYYRK